MPTILPPDLPDEQRAAYLREFMFYFIIIFRHHGVEQERVRM